MEETYDEDYELVIDKKSNNHYLKKYICDPSSRNKIVTTIKDIYNILDIVNKSIREFIQFLLKYSFDENTILEIQSNEYNSGLYIQTKELTNIELNKLIDFIKSYKNITYLEINKNIYLDIKYIDNLDDILIKRNFKSFHQNDDSVKKYLYKFLKNNIININNTDNLILFGGEMYGFPLFFPKKNIYAYSDFESIVEDTKYNCKYVGTEIINYNTFNYTKDLEKVSIICNTSKSGLGENMCNQINKIKANCLFIISCNKKSFEKDYCILCKQYKIVKNLQINSINIYLLQQSK
jgi:tRNA/tmRNA/rRNA uracil-C5-methylase (TrmA/RlmC/RlmD family)